MIGKIKGSLVFVDNNIGLIETSGGVSYSIFLTPSLIVKTKLNTEINVFTYLQVRDEAMVLFGFENRQDYDFFTLLLTVPGVGPKTAYNVISHSKTEEIYKAVRENNINYFSHIPGLGKKTAMKIILELSQKLKTAFNLEKMNLSDEDKIVIDALVSLGFTVVDARNIFQKIPSELTLEEKIKAGINLATRNNNK